MVYLFSLLLLTGCLEQVAQVRISNSQGLVRLVKEGELSFNVAFRRFARASDLGGFYRLLSSVSPTEDDYQAIHELLLAERGDERDLARKAYPLLHSVLKMADNDEIRPRDASIRGGALITERMAGALQSFAQEIGRWQGILPTEELSKQLQTTQARLAELETAYREFEYLYLNVGQDDYIVGKQIRRAVRYRISSLVGSLEGGSFTLNDDWHNPYTVLSKIFDEHRKRRNHNAEHFGELRVEVESFQNDFRNLLYYVEKSVIWWDHLGEVD